MASLTRRPSLARAARNQGVPAIGQRASGSVAVLQTTAPVALRRPSCSRPGMSCFTSASRGSQPALLISRTCGREAMRCRASPQRRRKRFRSSAAVVASSLTSAWAASREWRRSSASSSTTIAATGSTGTIMASAILARMDPVSKNALANCMRPAAWRPMRRCGAFSALPSRRRVAALESDQRGATRWPDPRRTGRAAGGPVTAPGGGRVTEPEGGRGAPGPLACQRLACQRLAGGVAGRSAPGIVPGVAPGSVRVPGPA